MKFIMLMFLFLLSLPFAVGCSPEPKDTDDSLGAATVFQWNQTTYFLTNGTISSGDVGEKLGEIKQEMVNRINCIECPAPSLYEGQEFFGIKDFDIKERIAVKQQDGYFVLKNKELLLKEKQK